MECFCWQEYIQALMNRTQQMEVKEPGAALETLRTTDPSWSSTARTPSGERDPTTSSSCSSVILP